MSIMQSQQTYSEVGTQVRMPRVNLLPPEILDGRRLRRTKLVLGGSLGVLAVALGGVMVLQVNAKHAAQDELADAKSQSVKLQAEQAKYADVPRTIAAIDAAEVARQTAMASDVEWYRAMTNFALTLPSNVWFDSVQMQVGSAAATPSTVTAAAAAVGGVGTLTVEGSALDHPDVATWLDVLSRQPGTSNAYFSNSEKKKLGDKTVVEFSSTATITDDALSHRFDRKQG